jgi:hypothetical protein
MSRSKTAESQQIAEQSAPVVSGHTPTPWEYRAGEYNREDDHGSTLGSIVSVGDEWFIATIEDAPEAQANAAIIVRAVNSLEPNEAKIAALVKALETFVEEYTALVNSGDAGFWDPEKEPKVIAARAALASAREVQP